MASNIYFIVFIALFAIRSLFGLIIGVKSEENPYTTHRKGKVSLLVFVNSFVVSGLATAFFLLSGREPNLYFYFAGLFLLIVGFSGRRMSLRDLGKSYSQYIEIRPDGQLVTSGVYSVVRHPLYLFYIIEMVAFVVVKPNYISLAALVLTVIATLYRIRKEDELLSTTFEDQFEVYSTKTRRLIPFIY